MLLLSVMGAMYFMHAIIGLHAAYWIVPVFGALGGLVGSLIRNANHLTLVTFDPQNCRIRLGFIGDIVLGLGGAAVVAFLFENTLNFDPQKQGSYPLMISVCFIAGVFGQLLIEIAGEKVIAKEALTIAKEAGKEAKEAGKETEALKLSASAAFVVASLYKIDKGSFGEALEAANKALELDSNNLRAIVAKARALKRLGKIREALAAVDDALARADVKATAEDRGVLLYNRACYNLLMNPADIDGTLASLEVAFPLRPDLRKLAAKDDDLRTLWDNPRFVQLTGDEPRQI